MWALLFNLPEVVEGVEEAEEAGGALDEIQLVDLPGPSGHRVRP
jgi:hypothetical protein